MPFPEQIVIRYRNHRGETADRTILPKAVWFGTTEWHEGEQWFLTAYDLEKGALRSFAMRDILAWDVTLCTG